MGEVETSAGTEVRLARWPRKRIVTGFLIAVLLAGGGGFALATTLRAEDSRTLGNALRPVRVTATVTERAVSLPPFQANLAAAHAIDVPVSAPPGTSTAAITATPKAPGDPVESGQELLEVSGRPLIALAMGLPMYRDLGVGMTGVDVKSLNQALNDIGLLSEVDDSYTYRTRIAVKELYEKNDAVSIGPLGGESLPMREVVRIPPGALTVGSVAALASVVGAGESAMTLFGGVPNVTLRVDALVKNSLQVGGEARISATGSSGDSAQVGRIVEISAFKSVDRSSGSADSSGAEPDKGTESQAPASDSTPKYPGYDVTLAFAEPEAVVWRQGASLTVTFAEEERKRLAVPLTAIREDGSKRYVNVPTKGAARRIDVSVVSQGDGWALLSDTPDLRVGDTVSIRS